MSLQESIKDFYNLVEADYPENSELNQDMHKALEAVHKLSEDPAFKAKSADEQKEALHRKVLQSLAFLFQEKKPGLKPPLYQLAKGIKNADEHFSDLLDKESFLNAIARLATSVHGEEKLPVGQAVGYIYKSLSNMDKGKKIKAGKQLSLDAPLKSGEEASRAELVAAPDDDEAKSIRGRSQTPAELAARKDRKTDEPEESAIHPDEMQKHIKDYLSAVTGYIRGKEHPTYGTIYSRSDAILKPETHGSVLEKMLKFAYLKETPQGLKTRLPKERPTTAEIYDKFGKEIHDINAAREWQREPGKPSEVKKQIVTVVKKLEPFMHSSTTGEKMKGINTGGMPLSNLIPLLDKSHRELLADPKDIKKHRDSFQNYVALKKEVERVGAQKKEKAAQKIDTFVGRPAQARKQAKKENPAAGSLETWEKTKLPYSQTLAPERDPVSKETSDKLKRSVAALKLLRQKKAANETPQAQPDLHGAQENTKLLGRIVSESKSLLKLTKFFRG